MKLAACVGNSFDLDTLAIVSEQSEVSAVAALWKALQEGFILPQSEVYKFYLSRESSDANINSTANVGYRFLHDRVQQAAYSLISELEKQQTHLKIGQLLLQNTPEVDCVVTIDIADNGLGMSESVKSRIFDHLFTTKPAGKGTGLGLAIARQIIVEKHGGTIHVDSGLGQGTIFLIELPIGSYTN